MNEPEIIESQSSQKVPLLSDIPDVDGSIEPLEIPSIGDIIEKNPIDLIRDKTLFLIDGLDHFFESTSEDVFESFHNTETFSVLEELKGMLNREVSEN